MTNQVSTPSEGQVADVPPEPNVTQDFAAIGTSPLRSVHSQNFPMILKRLGGSLAVSTYQAGFVVILRADGEQLNTHFARFPRPMGMTSSWDTGRLALGAAREVVEFRNMQALCPKLDGNKQHDACYLPRRSYITSDIDIHEMAYVGDELWIVNTRFSCLCTLDGEHSFVPRWKPPFITGYDPSDRCHLNGLAVIDDKVKYVTALGDTDTPQGWRERKIDGGVLIDVESGETIVSGLSMPHSPRWANDRLWLLESGQGGIGYVDLDEGKYVEVARANGFTRGLTVIGNVAFVGLSQVRESAVFGGIPLADRIKKDEERICGVSVIDLEAGREVAMVHFKDAVQEVFAVETLPHRFPEMLDPSSEHLRHAYALPDEALELVPEAASQQVEEKAETT